MLQLIGTTVIPLDQPSGREPPGQFLTTHWSLVVQAGEGDSTQARQALERLCQAYWYPRDAFVRLKGHPPPDAQDLTQEFFARFLERKYVALADQSRGKFRTFLIRSLEHFLINEWVRAKAVKRGGSHPVVSWDELEAENRYRAERVDGLAPDKVYEKRWALSVLDAVMARLRAEFIATERQELFDALSASVWGEKSAVPYAEIGARLGLAENAVGAAAHRLRTRYRELLRSEVAQTVASASEVDEELRYLASVLRT